MNIKILVATHKKYWMPDDEIYLPIHVGKQGKESIGFIGDESGDGDVDNISHKNPYYCELTGLYWAFKNLDADYIGLAHYRRHFTRKFCYGVPISRKKRIVLTGRELREILNSYDAVLPNKRRYYVETNRSHYNHAHNARDLDTAEVIIKEKYPQYTDSFKCVMTRTWGHRFNMFVLKKEDFKAYCTWLFDILSELEKRIDISDYSKSEARVFGYISERLFDVWIENNKIRYKEVNVMFLERQNWPKKIYDFLYRKFKGAR